MGQREVIAVLEARANGRLNLASTLHFYDFESFKHNKLLEPVEGPDELMPAWADEWMTE